MKFRRRISEELADLICGNPGAVDPGPDKSLRDQLPVVGQCAVPPIIDILLTTADHDRRDDAPCACFGADPGLHSRPPRPTPQSW
jgi:hypothetical protein